MQVVIEIDDKLYNRIKYLEPKSNTMLDVLMRSVQNGTLIPKGHGRIADIDKVLEEMRATRTYDILFALERVKPIIEVDKEG
jgi:hypothetical protein